MSKVDITPEAVEREAKALDNLAVILAGPGQWSTSAATLRAQAERIRELEGQLDRIATGGLTERINLKPLAEHPNVKKLTTKARNDALLDVRVIAKRYDDEAACMRCTHTVGILREIDALIEGDKP